MRNHFSQFLFVCLKAERQVTMNQRFSSKERRVYGNRNIFSFFIQEADALRFPIHCHYDISVNIQYH